MTKRTRRLLGAGLVAASAFALALTNCAHPTRVRRAPAPGEPVLEVMTYNVNFGIPGDPPTLAAIRDEDSDVVLLQETTPEWEASLRQALHLRYPYMSFRHCCGAGGLAVLSKRPFEVRDYLEGPEGSWFPALRLLAQTPLGPVQILSVHLHPPLSAGGGIVSGYFSTPAIRESEIAAFARTLDPALPTLVAGDFNESPSGGVARFLAKNGLVSALPEFAPSQRTWRWTTSVGEVSSQLDHIAYDAHLEPLDVRALEAGRSDHLPVVGLFQRAR
ncbi:MAG: endonuclease/exonuclease/phosphatase family protein [Myxococcaceae bacterium]